MVCSCLSGLLVACWGFGASSGFNTCWFWSSVLALVVEFPQHEVFCTQYHNAENGINTVKIEKNCIKLYESLYHVFSDFVSNFGQFCIKHYIRSAILLIAQIYFLE